MGSRYRRNEQQNAIIFFKKKSTELKICTGTSLRMSWSDPGVLFSDIICKTNSLIEEKSTIN